MRIIINCNIVIQIKPNIHRTDGIGKGKYTHWQSGFFMSKAMAQHCFGGGDLSYNRPLLSSRHHVVT